MSVFEYDHTLPSLPIPKLEDTCRRLKEMAQPLVDEATWNELCQALYDFQNGDGATLQQQLLQWKEERPGNSSWLRPIWDDNYLSYRDRSPVNMNYTLKLTHKRYGDQALPKLLHGFCHILTQLRTESLPTEMIRETPQSMDALSHMLYTRIPELNRDILYYLPLSAPYTISVVCKGHWFLVGLTDENGDILSPDAIQKALDDIRIKASQMPVSAGISAFTCTIRDRAAGLRNLIQENPRNRMNLEGIQDSICVVCLDDVDEAGFMHNLLLGKPQNRWFDKSIQFVWDGQDLGLNLEHSGCDASIWIYLLSQLDEYVLHQMDSVPSTAQAHIRSLDWIVSSDLLTELVDVIEDYSTFVSKIRVSDKKSEVCSRENIKAKKCRPDSTVQILYQAAYYKLTGKIRSSYEPVSSRTFYQGRTECLRPGSSATAEFAKCLVDNYNSVSADTLLEKFRAAEQSHVEQIKRCQAGLGPERHIAGLVAMHTMDHSAKPLPGLFETEGFKAIKHDAISTSSTTGPCIEYFGFCPVVPDGIGIGYGIKSDALHIVVSAYDDSSINPDKFLSTLEEMADRLFHLL